MNVLFEEDGALRVASVLSEEKGALQIEAPTGRRGKIRGDRVLLSFQRPTAAELFAEAETRAAEIDVPFLWEVAGSEEFGFTDLAREYSGHEPSPVESAAILWALWNAPTHFYKKGSGRFKAATTEQLKNAQQAAERQQKRAERQTELAQRMVQGELPKEIAARLPTLLYKPDPSWIETKAVNEAAQLAKLPPLRLLERAGAVKSAREYHLGRFLLDFFPKGTQFQSLPPPDEPGELPAADVEAFSIDDASTTEIDDAFSVTRLPDGSLRVGVHIAAPALGFLPGSPLDAVARQRLSTVYLPGDKITMLPQPVIERFSLDEGEERPAMSLYLTVSGDGSYRILTEDTRLERVRITKNLRHQDLDTLLTEEALRLGRLDFSHGPELKVLYELAGRLQAGRGKPEQEQLDFSFFVENDRVRIVPRPRGAPADKLVAELMIHANVAWGKKLGDRDVRALYRVQDSGKVRLSLYPAPHLGLGVSQYLWSSSPLRRYCDLVNQWLLIAELYGEPSPFSDEGELLQVMRDFETTYSAYDEFQRAMERYFSLRFLLQEGIRTTTATVIKDRDNLVRLNVCPLWQRIPPLPELPVGTQINVEVSNLDEYELTAHIEYRGKVSS